MIRTQGSWVRNGNTSSALSHRQNKVKEDISDSFDTNLILINRGASWKCQMIIMHFNGILGIGLKQTMPNRRTMLKICIWKNQSALV